MNPATPAPAVEVFRFDPATLVLRADCLSADPAEIGAALAAWAGPDALALVRARLDEEARAQSLFLDLAAPALSQN